MTSMMVMMILMVISTSIRVMRMIKMIRNCFGDICCRHRICCRHLYNNLRKQHPGLLIRIVLESSKSNLCTGI